MLPAVLVALPSPLMLIGRPWAHTCSPILLVLCQKLEAIIIPIESVMQPDLAPKSSAKAESRCMFRYFTSLLDGIADVFSEISG